MNNLILQSLTVIALLLLTACSTTNNAASFSPAAAPSEQAVVYIYRPNVMANAIYSPDLYVNDEFKLSLKSGNSTRLLFNAGKYTFKVAPDKNYSGLTQLSINLMAGSTYYVRVDSTLKINNGIEYQPYQRSFNLIDVNASLAIAQISECCTNKQKAFTNNTETITRETEPKEGFSVNKTQNPFSH